MSHRVAFGDLGLGDHVYTVNGHGTFTHHGIVVEKGPDVRSSLVIEFNVPRDSVLPQVVTPDLLLRPDSIMAMIVAARVQMVTLEAFTPATPDPHDPSATNNRAIGLLRRVRYVSPTALVWMARAGANRAASCLAVEQTVALAYQFLHNGEWPVYEVILNNCEHFAVYCKTGVAQSAQSERLPKRTRNDLQRRLDRIVRMAAKNKMRFQQWLPRQKRIRGSVNFPLANHTPSIAHTNSSEHRIRKIEQSNDMPSDY